MEKKNIPFAVGGLVLGLIIGFVATNSYNRNALSKTGAPMPPNAQTQGQQPASQNPGAMVPGVAEAIDKADKNPDDFDAQIKAGEMFSRIKNYDKAITYYEKANKAKPDDYQTIVSLGTVNFDAAMPKENGQPYDPERLKTVQKWYEKALAIKPDDVDVRADYGLTFFLKEPKDTERAIKEYKSSLALNPNHEMSLQNLAAAYAEIKDGANLKETMTKLEKVNPNNPVVQRLKEAK